MTAAPAPTDPLAIAKQLFNDAVADVLPVVVPLIENFLTSMAGNPSAINLATQLAILQSSLMGAEPAVASAFVKQVNALISAQETAFLTSQTAAPGATGATGPAA